MPSIELGAKIFPYQRFIRTGPAYFAITWIEPSSATVDLISSVLRTDPLSADLTNGLAFHAFAIRDDFRANATWRAFTHIAPNSPRTPRLKEALDALH